MKFMREILLVSFAATQFKGYRLCTCTWITTLTLHDIYGVRASIDCLTCGLLFLAFI